MDAVAQAAGGDVGDVVLEDLVVLLEGGPAVHEEEDVAPGLVGEFAGRATAAVGGDGVDAVGAEVLFAAVEDAQDFGDSAADLLGVEAGGSASHVGEVGDGGHASATEVEAVELDFSWGVGECEGRDKRAEQGGLAGLWAADDEHVSCRAGEVTGEEIAALLEGLVDDSEGNRETPEVWVVGFGEAAFLGGSEPGE